MTAQKRAQRISDVPMSIQAATGDQLAELGVKDVGDLSKVSPGLQANTNFVGTQVFTIRGIGFQDTSLGATPTVGVYVDEVPLPFSALTSGATLDLERVEVLKGPQGTLFGTNVTGGAINYIAAKPTDTLKAGIDLSYGRFEDIDASAFISGPLGGGLKARLAGRVNRSDEWQKGYDLQEGQEIGGKNLVTGRLTLEYSPDDSPFRARLTVDGWQDKGYMQMPQKYGNAALVPGLENPAVFVYPKAPKDNRYAGWNRCVNTSPFNPVENQESGTLLAGYPTPVLDAILGFPTGIDPNLYLSTTPESMGAGSAVWAGAQPTECIPARKDNSMAEGNLRLDYDFSDDITVTTLTSYLDYDRNQDNDSGGVPYQIGQFHGTGSIKSFFQEARVSGPLAGTGNWIVGGNYQDSKVNERLLATLAGSSAQPILGFLPYGPTLTHSDQTMDSWAIYGNAEYPLTDTLSIFGGARYTDYEVKSENTCSADGGDGNTAYTFNVLRALVFGALAEPTAPGDCITINTLDAVTLGYPPADGYNLLLRENNVSWRAGLNYRPTPDTMFYVSASKGYKSGSFTNVGASVRIQLEPAVQEALTAYEAGVKTSMLERQVQFNAAAFYYDYENKQFQGSVQDLVLGAVQKLVNIPESRVWGFEVSGQITPNALEGLTITPALSYQNSKILSSGKNNCDSTLINCKSGHYYNYTIYAEYADLTGLAFPNAPEWQGSIDAQYKFPVGEATEVFVGSTLTFASSTYSGFYNRFPTSSYPDDYNDPLHVKPYELLDLRVGIEHGSLTAMIWGRNVLDEYYWMVAQRGSDSLTRYTGMPATYGISLSYRYR